MGEQTPDVDRGQRCRWEKYFNMLLPSLSFTSMFTLRFTQFIKLGANDFTQQDSRVVCMFKVK